MNPHWYQVFLIALPQLCTIRTATAAPKTNFLPYSKHDIHPLSICDTIDATTCSGPPSCLFPNPDDCKFYIQCDGARETFILPCAPGLKYNQDLASCTLPEDSTCPDQQQQQKLDVANPPAASKDPVLHLLTPPCTNSEIASTSCKGAKDCLYPNPANCATYITCTVNKDNMTGTPHVMACPKGLEWNNIDKICICSELSTCPIAIVIAMLPLPTPISVSEKLHEVLTHDGIFGRRARDGEKMDCARDVGCEVRDPKRSERYVECGGDAEGKIWVPVVVACETGMAWDVERGRCVLASANDAGELR